MQAPGIVPQPTARPSVLISSPALERLLTRALLFVAAWGLSAAAFAAAPAADAPATSSTPAAPAAAPPAAAASAAAIDPGADPLPAPLGRTVRIGVQENAAPFAFKALRGPGSAHHRGYTVDICLRIVELMRQDMGLGFDAERDVEFVPVTSKKRLVQLLTGQIDMECGSTSNTPARRSLGVAFSPTVFVSDVGLLLSPHAAAHSQSLGTVLEFLKQGKLALVTTEGSTSVRHARALVELSGGRLSLLLGTDHRDSLRLLRNGDAHAFVMDRALLAAALKTNRHLPERGFVLPAWSPAPGQLECYGIMTRGLVFASFGQRVRDKLAQMRRNGELRELYERWFRRPLTADKLLPRMQPGQALGVPLREEFEMLQLDPQYRPCGEVAL